MRAAARAGNARTRFFFISIICEGAGRGLGSGSSANMWQFNTHYNGSMGFGNDDALRRLRILACVGHESAAVGWKTVCEAAVGRPSLTAVCAHACVCVVSAARITSAPASK